MKRLISLFFLLLFMQPSFAQEVELPQVPDTPLQSITVPFNGQWLPDADPIEIGANNFKTLSNMRYRTGGIEGVRGYTKINTTAINETQDYTDYTEVDVGADRVSVAASQLMITDLDSDEEVYIYKSFGVDRFSGDFQFHLDINLNPSAGARCYLWGLTNKIDDLYSSVASGLFLYAEGGNTPKLYIYESWGNILPINFSLSTDYYLTIKRDESVGIYGTLYLYMYSDSNRTALVDSATITLTSKADFRYLYAMSAFTIGVGGKTFNGTISNLKIVYAPQSGFHFKKDQPPETHVLVQASGKVIQNIAAIPDQGNFLATALHEDAPNAGLGRFSNAPGGMAYCNEKENLVWSGDEMPISGFITLTQVKNTYTLSFDTTADTIIDDGGANFVTDGYKPGQIIDVTGSVDNNRSFTIDKINNSGAATNNRMYVVENLATQANDAGCTMKARIETEGYKDPIDYIEAVNNKLTTTGNLALIGGGVDSDAKLMLHCEGSNESTTFTDDSDSGHTPTANGDAQIDTSRAKFGGSSGLFDGTGDYLSVPDSADWFMGTGAFTIDFWVKFNTAAGRDGFFQQYVDDNNYISCSYYGPLIFRVQSPTGSATLSYTWSPSINTWYHIAIIRGWGSSANGWALTLNGTTVATVSDTEVMADLAADFDIGRDQKNTALMDGHIDEFRVSKGIARWTANFTPPARAYKERQDQWLTLSTRPLQGLKYYIDSVNMTASTTTGKVWNGHSFSDLTITDGTITGAAPNEISLSQDGSMVFDSTVDVAKPFHFKGSYLYAYLFELSAGEADIYHVTADAPFQPVVNVWDEVYRQAIMFQAYLDGAYEDFSAAVSVPSGATGVFGADIDDMTSAEHCIVMFEERMSALFVGMASGAEVNLNPSIPTVEYYNGSDWAEVSQLVDGTSDDDNDWETFGQTGLISWSPPGENEEVEQTLFGIKGYAYRVKVGATLDATVTIDIVYGIPAQASIPPFKFPAQFKNRLLLCGNIEGKQGNRIDYSMPNSSDVWNGELSSMNGIQSIYIGGEADLSCGTQLYNRYGSNVFAFFLAFKDNELYVLSGDNPDDFKVFPVSTIIGCPAPMTLDTAEVGYEMSEDVKRQIALWVSSVGPMMFDGGVITPMEGVETFFDPSSSDCITLSSISDAHGWYDSTYGEYNIVFPVDSLWLVYDLKKRKWYRKIPAAYPDCAFPVKDVNGTQYIYAGLSTGYMMRLENGNTWDGTGIAQTVETGDFSPSENLWHKTRLRKFKIAAKDVTEAISLVMTHYSDTATSGTTLTPLNLSSGANRIVRSTQATNLLGWTHRIKFAATSSSTDKGFQPVAWGYQYRTERIDE